MSNLNVSPIGRRYGALADPPDERDYTVASFPPLAGKPWYKRLASKLFPFGKKQETVSAENNERVSHQAFLGPVKNQGSEGSCTGHAGTGMAEFIGRKYLGLKDLVLSAQFAYWWNRRNDGKIEVEEGQSAPGTELKYIPIDRGAQMRSICRTLRWQGCCLEKSNPYRVGDFKRKPTLATLEEALNYKLGAFHRITEGLDEMKAVLRSGYVFVAAIQIYDSFESDYVAHTGCVPVPNTRKEQHQGGHAILVYGFDDKRQVLLCRNSWGSDWGDRGDFTLPYEFAMNSYLMNDCWVQHLGKAWK